MTDNYRLFPAEFRMMDLFWKHEPMSTMELVHLCEKEMGWKKNTTFTQIKRMTDRGFIKKENTILTSLVTRDMVEQFDSNEIIRERFSNSLPNFVAAFIKGRGISPEEAEQLMEIIDNSIK